LKALLEERGIPIVKIHDLEKLLTMLRANHPGLAPLSRGMRFLTDFAVDPRYPNKTTTKRAAEAALRWMDRVRDIARTLLGIRPRPRRK
jgi:HEPN domain-containing protein